jgi:hypothetical protein
LFDPDLADALVEFGRSQRGATAHVRHGLQVIADGVDMMREVAQDVIERGAPNAWSGSELEWST